MAKILIVDDDPSVLSSMRRYFEEAGDKVTTAASGEIALKLVEFNPPEIIISDVQMYGMTGLDLCKKLKGQYPILMMSGSTKAQKQCMDAGAEAFFEKPFQLEEMQKVVRYLMEDA